MDNAFPVRDVSSWQRIAAETAGRDEKDWRREPTSERRWLFKPVTVHGGWAQGEDWSEKLSSEIARLLRVPCARVELAQSDDDRGSISLDLRGRGWEMYWGADLLAGIVPGYQSKQKGRTGHSLDNVAAVLKGRLAPPGSEMPESFGAFDVFAGYLTFDALIANQDRHEQNWSILRPPDGGPDALAGSYDHGSSLGFNLRDAERERRLGKEGDVRAWAARGKAERFEQLPGERAPTLTAHARSALLLAGHATRDHWLAAVDGLHDDDVAALVAKVPHLSQETRNFITELVSVNRSRILDEC